MEKWILKAIIQKIISYLPYSSSINYIFQKYVTKGVNLSDEYFNNKIGHAADHINSYTRYTGKRAPLVCLELGTGWYPVVPIALFLSGAEKIFSIDISFLTSKERIRTSIRKIIEYNKAGKLQQLIPYSTGRMTELESILSDIDNMTLNQVLDALHIEYLVGDARQLPLPAGTIDLITSNNTFEHIYPEILTGILKEFKRVLSPQGLMSHFIDMSDHFAHMDKSITIYNFLRFSHKQWSRIDNTIQPQNRLRINDYKKIYSDLNIPIIDSWVREGSLNDLGKINVDQQFLKDRMDDIAISHCHFISN